MESWPDTEDSPIDELDDDDEDYPFDPDEEVYDMEEWLARLDWLYGG